MERARVLVTAAAISAIVLGVGCTPETALKRTKSRAAATVVDDVAHERLVQFSLLSALAADDYLGTATLTDVLRSGDFGVGTFERLDGEMIVLDGVIYQALADGSIRRPALSGKTPFATVTFFHADGRIDKLSAATLDDLDQQLDAKLPNRNTPCAIRIDGTFTELALRSVPAQTPPFRPLVDVVKHQATFEHNNVRGTLIGIRCPAWLGTLNVAGYHWHFLSDDRQIGGHVLGCEFSDCTLEFDECTSVLIRLPGNAEFQNFDEQAVSQDDVDRIERQRTN